MFEPDSPSVEETNSIMSVENNASNNDAPSSSLDSTENLQQPSTSQPKKKSSQRSQVCEFLDAEKGQCKQRAIVTYKYCIRHILNDLNAPYKRCEMMSKSKKGVQKPCTNAIKKELNQIYCSTHLIMLKELEPKKRKKTGQAASEGSADNAPPSNTQDSCFGDDDHRTNISDADFADICPSPHAFTPDNEFMIPATSNSTYTGPLISKSPLVRTSVQSNNPNQMLVDVSPVPRTLIKSSANLGPNITQHQVIVPLQSNGITTRIIPTPNNSSSPHLAAHLIQTTSQKTNIIYNQNDLIVNETIPVTLNEAPRIKIQSTDVNGHPTITLVNGQTQLYSTAPMVQRIEVTELPAPPPKPIVRILCKKSPLEFFDSKPPLIMYDVDSVKIDDTTSEMEKLKRDYLNDSPPSKRKSKMIKLHQKRRKLKTEGFFRSISTVDHMCQVIEDYDFDNTDLFPLGLEPSDDESLSDDDIELSHLPSIRVNPRDFKSSRLALYLMKKRLRRESEKLQRNAKLSMAIMNAARTFPDSVGTAFRLRTMSRKRRNLNGLNFGLQQCFYTERGNKHRCQNICIPRSSLCSTHIGYNVDQRAFVFCKTPCCGKPVSKVNSLVFNGMCEEHYLNGGKSVLESANARSVGYQPHQHHFNAQNSQNPAVYRHVHHESSSAHTSNEQPSHSYPENPENFVENQLINSITIDDFNVSDVVEGDVLLGCVANELFDNHEINDMLDQFPVEEVQPEDHNAVDLDDSDNLMSVFPKSMKVSGVEDSDMHLWTDITEFLRSEGYSSVDSPPHN